MDLAVNGIRLNGKRHGVGRYIEYLLQHWATMDHPFERIRVFTPVPLDRAVAIAGRVDACVIPTTGSNAYWEQVVLPRHAGRKDLLFCPSYVVPVVARGATVVTHLGSYEAIPSAFPWRERIKARWTYQLSAMKADLVITVSESSRRDIMQYYGIAPDKIRVIPLGVSPAFLPMDDVDGHALTRRRYFGDDRPYVLFVGKLSKRRNIPELIKAFARLKADRRLQHGLLLIGENSAGQNIPELARTLGVGDAVIHRDYADHGELVRAYNAADIFIYPSSYEGFGIPVLEAMACGTPTITLGNSAFLEFADGATYLAANGGVAELYRAMDVVLSSPDLRSRLRDNGVRQARNYRWDGIAERTMAVLAEVAQRKGTRSADFRTTADRAPSSFRPPALPRISG